MDTFGLRIQEINSVQERTLVLGSLAGVRSGDGWLSSSDVAELFRQLRLPVPTNSSQALKQLSKKHLVTRNSKTRRWAVTPVGQRRVRDLLASLDDKALLPELRNMPGADFGHALHPVVPPFYAPAKWTRRIADFLDSFPFERNIFLMTRFAEPSSGDKEADEPLGASITVIRSAAEAHGLTLHLASDRQIDDDVLGNVAAHMWACQYGIGLLENRQQMGLNYNVMTELGAMLMTGRRCALLKDRTSPNLPTDVIGQIYKPVDFDNHVEVQQAVHHWIADDLSLGRCEVCRNL